MQKTVRKSEEFVEIESTYGAHNYHPIPVIISKEGNLGVPNKDLQNPGLRFFDRQ